MAGRHLYLIVILHIICMSLVCHLHLILCHSLCSRMPFSCHSYVIRMPFVCTPMSFIYHSYVLVCHSYVICISLICICMSLVWHPYVLVLSFVCHSYVRICHSFIIRYVLVCHSYVLYVIRAFFTKNFFKAVVTMHIQRSRRKYLIKSKSYRLSNNNYFCKPIINVLKPHWLTLSLTLHDYQFSQSLSCCHPKTAFIFYAKIMDVCGRNHLYEYIMKGNISITKLH